MKRPRLNTSWLLAALFLIAAALWLLTGTVETGGEGRAAPAPAAASAEPEAAPKSVRVVVSEAMQRQDVVAVTGHTAASRKVTLMAEADGPIAALPLERGAAVAEGDAIATIDPEDRKARLAEAEALLRQREAEYEAARKLNQRGYKGDIALAESAAQLDGARAAVKRMQIEMGNTLVAAPFGGVIEERPVELGSYVQAGDPIATIVDLDPLRVVGFVTERDVAGLKPGAPGEAVLPDGRTVPGTLAFISAVADEATRTFKVELEVPNADGALAEGLTAELRIPTGLHLAHKLSPALLSLADDGRIGVKVVEAGGVVRFLPVQILGNADPDTLWVAGLPQRVTVITVGQEFVKEGETVEAVPMPAPIAGGGAAG